jgi:hypothetical protein
VCGQLVSNVTKTVLDMNVTIDIELSWLILGLDCVHFLARDKS